MKPSSTAIAVALALVIVIGVFVFGFPLFQQPASPAGTQDAAATQPTDTGAPATTNTQQMNDLSNVTTLQVQDNVVGTGDTAEAGDTVTVDYVGALADGTVFDASKNHGDQGFTFTLGAGQVIKGWDEGVAGMKVGGTRTLIIPASLGYGAQGIPNVIPANATLIFQVQLRSVQKAAQ